MSRKNAFGPIGRLEPPQRARELFLLSNNSGLCTHLSLRARRDDCTALSSSGDSEHTAFSNCD